MGPSGADRTQVGPMLTPWTLLSGVFYHSVLEEIDFVEWWRHDMDTFSGLLFFLKKFTEGRKHSVIFSPLLSEEDADPFLNFSGATVEV